MSRVLFVCTGNVARSQMAQVLYNHMTKSNDAMSAGTEVTEGKPIHEDVLATLAQHNLTDPSLFRKHITEKMFSEADRVVVMTNHSLPPYITGDKVTFWEVPDPRDKGPKVHEETFNLLAKKVKELVGRDD